MKLPRPEPNLPLVLYQGETLDVWAVFTVPQTEPTEATGFMVAEYLELYLLTALPCWSELDPEKAIRPQDQRAYEVPFLP